MVRKIHSFQASAILPISLAVVLYSFFLCVSGRVVEPTLNFYPLSNAFIPEGFPGNTILLAFEMGMEFVD